VVVIGDGAACGAVPTFKGGLEIGGDGSPATFALMTTT
jgi:hypothetical protein